MKRARVWTTLGAAVLLGCGQSGEGPPRMPSGDAGSDAGDDLPEGDAQLPPAPDAGEPDASTEEEIVRTGSLSEGALRSIEGAPDALAADALPATGPLPGSGFFASDGRIDDRLTVLLDPELSVAELNAALGRHSLGVALSRPPSLVVTLATLPMSHAGAQALLAALESEGVALTGWLAYPLGPQHNPQAPGAIQLDQDSTTLLRETASHLTGPRFPGAWNALPAASERVTVLVPDSYFGLGDGTPAPHPEIPSQRFGTGSRGIEGSRRRDFHEGNHGYWVSGILGASFDGARPTGTSPDPARLLDIVSIDAARLETFEMLAMLAFHFPEEGRFLVSASRGCNDVDFEQHPLINRATAALNWRSFLLDHPNEPLVLAAAGNDGDEPTPPHARLNSAFTTQALVGDLSALFPADHPDRADFLVEWQRRTTLDPRLATSQGHSLVVGSARIDGSPLPSSTPGHDVRMVGENVEGPCVVAHPSCELPLGVASSSGTSAATPAAAGLAAYMWSMDPELPAVDLRARLLASRSADRWIDAYDAVLSLEQDGGPKIRAAIADVAGGANGRGDGQFDEDDLLAIVEALNATLDVPFEQRKPDWSRFDLNGDGFTRRDTFAKLDLDADGTIGMARIDIGGRTSSFDEQQIADLEYLCYIAFTPEYVGNRAVPEAMASSCRSLDDGPPDVLRPYAGTVSYTVTHVGPPIRSCSSAASRTTTKTLSSQVSCAAFDPRTSVGRCNIVSGDAAAALNFSGQVGAAATVTEFSTFSCMQDSDCGGTVPLCMGQTDACGTKHDVPGTCGSCEVFTTSAKTFGSSGSVDLAEHAGTQLLLVGTSGSFRGGELASLSQIEVAVLGSATETVARRGECSIGGGSSGGTSAIGELLSVGTGTSFDLGIEIDITDDAITGGASGTRSSGVAPDESQTTWSVSLSLQAL